jgi:ketopantoate reductase
LPKDQAVESVIARGRMMESRGMTGVRISTLQDLERDRRTEADQVIGHVVRLAKAQGVPVPLLGTLLRIVHGIESSSQPAAAASIDRPT